ncbi:MAG: uracil-DNA glycosylase [Pseudomonadota bacterium]
MNNHQSNAKNRDTGRRAQLLAEMRLGPLWQLRQAEATVGETEPSSPPLEQAAQQADQSADNVQATPSLQRLPPRQEAIAQSRHAPAPATLEDAFAAAADVNTAADAPPSAARPPLSADVLSDRALQRADAIAEMGWDELEASVAGCRACGLCEGRAKTVFGVGDRRAQWLFVGEGPGYNENLQGEPFVGAAGHLLDNMMRALDMQRGENTFIANVVKCRPTDAQGKDRPPTPEEAAACLPYLKRQVELIKPAVIVALGKTAAISLLGLDPETPVGQLRGKLHRYAKLPLVVTYHPAYLLRKPAEKSKAWSDLCLAQAAAMPPAEHA